MLFYIAWGLIGVSHLCHMVQNGVAAENSCMGNLTDMKLNTTQPNLRRALKLCYGNYWMHLVTSLHMCDGRFSTSNFAANALMILGGRAELS